MSSAGGLFDDLGDDDNLWSDTIPKGMISLFQINIFLINLHLF